MREYYRSTTYAPAQVAARYVQWLPIWQCDFNYREVVLEVNAQRQTIRIFDAESVEQIPQSVRDEALRLFILRRAYSAVEWRS